MASGLVPEIKPPGFSFENFTRNNVLYEKGFKPPRTHSTGTTICGVIYDGGVVLGADTRATMGNIVFEKDTDKLHHIASNIYAAGAGTSADINAVILMVKSHVELHRLNSGREVPVCVAKTKICQHLFRYQGHVGAAYVLGGVDDFGTHLACIHPYGSVQESMYTSMGSGSVAAMATLEAGYKKNLSLEEAKLLVRDAVLAGVENDLGSGNGIDLCVITKGNTEILKKFYVPESTIPSQRQGNYKFNIGTTPVLDRIVKFEIEESTERELDPDRFMETA